MRSPLRLTVVAGALAAVTVVSVAAAAPSSPGGPAEAGRVAERIQPQYSFVEEDPAERIGREVVELTNVERRKRGLPDLAWDTVIFDSALAHSEYQARIRTMTHRGSGGSNAGQRLVAAGYSHWGWAENVAAGQPDAASVVGSWMKSDGHRANMLGDFEFAAAAMARSSDGVPYWTMVFANPGP